MPDYANKIIFINNLVGAALGLSAFHPCLVHEHDATTQQDADAVGQEVQPFTTAVGGEVGLAQFHQATPKYRTDETLDGQTGGGDLSALGTEEFPPDDDGQSAVHDEMRPFVKQGYVLGYLRRTDGGKGEDEDGDGA